MKNLRPNNVRLILIILDVLVLGLIIFGYVMGMSSLAKTAGEVNKAAINAKSSENKISRMKVLKTEMEDIKDTRDLVNKMVAPQSSFRYQERSISTLNEYANQAGVAISQVSFTTSGNAIQTANNSNKVNISVMLANPVNYNNFLKFMKLVEGGLSQMQITQVDINQEKDKSNDVSVGPLSIEIYVK